MSSGILVRGRKSWNCKVLTTSSVDQNGLQMGPTATIVGPSLGPGRDSRYHWLSCCNTDRQGIALKRNPAIDAVAASDLVSSSVLAALIGMLGAKGVLSDVEVREIYEQALYLLEARQNDEPETASIYEAAREIIEAQLRPDD